MKMMAVKLNEENTLDFIEECITKSDNVATRKLLDEKEHRPSLLSKKAKRIVVLLLVVQFMFPLIKDLNMLSALFQRVLG